MQYWRGCEHIIWRVAALTVFLACLQISAVPISAAAEEDFVWSFQEGNDPDNRGRATARLTYGVPETDNQIVSGICDARPSTSNTVSVITLAADTGQLSDGKAVKVRFSGGGIEHELAGEVTGVRNTQEAISGVTIRPEHNDRLWRELIEQNIVEYRIVGYRSNNLNFRRGRDKIQSFVDTCKSYTDAVLPDRDRASQQQPKQSSDIDEKEAFEQSKELGSIEAWEAFLNRFPTGYRADLARAYVKRLAQGNQGASGNSKSTSDTAQAPARSDDELSDLSTVDPGPGSIPWVTGKKRLATNKNKALYSASVRANGVELVMYCVDWNKTGGVGQGIFAVLREYPRGAYPKYRERIDEGLRFADAFRGEDKKVSVIFSNGAEANDVTIRQSAPNGELTIGTLGQAISQGRAFQSIMSEDSMTVLLPPFSTTLQLTGSRQAICRMANRCGANVAGCGALASDDDDSSYDPPSSQRKKCSGGRYRNRRGRCVCPSKRPRWTGSRCKKAKKTYDPGQDAPPKCGRGRTWVGAQGRCVCIDSNKRWNGKRCVAKQKKCKWPRVYDKQIGGCVCQGDSSWNGRQCVKDNEPPPQNDVKSGVCSVFATACQLGSKQACKNFKKAGC